MFAPIKIGIEPPDHNGVRKKTHELNRKLCNLVTITCAVYLTPKAAQEIDNNMVLNLYI